MSHVLVVFQANHELVEQLALAAAVGAVEAEALIRLRRLAAPDAPEVGHKSYGRLAMSDLVWADAILIGLEDPTPNPAELDPLIDLLKELNAESAAPKRALTFNSSGSDTCPTDSQVLVNKHLASAGMSFVTISNSTPADLPARMNEVGRAAAAARV